MLRDPGRTLRQWPHLCPALPLPSPAAFGRRLPLQGLLPPAPAASPWLGAAKAASASPSPRPEDTAAPELPNLGSQSGSESAGKAEGCRGDPALPHESSIDEARPHFLLRAALLSGSWLLPPSRGRAEGSRGGEGGGPGAHSPQGPAPAPTC